MRAEYTVASDYECAYPDPLTASRGDALTTHEKDGEWPGWIWCTTASGVAGWVPEAWLDRRDDGTGTLRRDYTARELTVRRGEHVTASRTESGWAWVTDAEGRSGWVPLANLAR